MINFKKINNKFIIGVIILIILIVGLEVKLNNTIDKNSYATLVQGSAYLNEKNLEINKREKLTPGDNLKTMGEQSLVVIEWGEGSITRLGGNSHLEIKENLVSNNLNKIQISFKLISGKTWSNVISFMGEDSYFKEYYADSEAAVRGTIFDLNLEEDYLYVDKHEVVVTKLSGEKIVVPEKSPFDLQKFSFISIQEFLKSSQDMVWSQLNKKLDKELFLNLKSKLGDVKELKKELLSNVKYLNGLSDTDFKLLNDKIATLDEKSKKELFNNILEKYQRLNFISSEDVSLYEQKILYKKALILFSGEKDKQNLVRTTVYDLNNLNTSDDFKNLKLTLGFLNDNKDILNSIDINLSEYINFDFLPEDLKQQFKNQYNFISDIVSSTKNDAIEELKNAKTIAEKLKEKADELRDTTINNLLK